MLMLRRPWVTNYLNATHLADFGNVFLEPLNLLKVHELHISGIFPNVLCRSTWLLLSSGAWLKQRGHSAGTPGGGKNLLRSTVCQEHHTDLRILTTESKLARKLSFEYMIATFTNTKAGQTPLNRW